MRGSLECFKSALKSAKIILSNYNTVHNNKLYQILLIEVFTSEEITTVL